MWSVVLFKDASLGRHTESCCFGSVVVWLNRRRLVARRVNVSVSVSVSVSGDDGRA